MANANRVQSFRGVGCTAGYPYFAFGLYEPRRTADGRQVYRLVASGPRVRSDVRGRTAFPGVPVVPGVRHNSPVPA